MPEEMIFLLPLAVMVLGGIYVLRNSYSDNAKGDIKLTLKLTLQEFEQLRAVAGEQLIEEFAKQLLCDAINTELSVK